MKQSKSMKLYYVNLNAALTRAGSEVEDLIET